MIISIHQPNFIPWLGFFSKILRSDIFIFFDNVQFPRGKTFGNRVKIKTQNGGQWLTIPVSGKSDLLKFKDIQIVKDRKIEKIIKTLEANYRKAKYFYNYFDDICYLLSTDFEFLADLNIEIIKYILKCLDSETELYRESELQIDPVLSGGDEILEIINHFNATVYLSGSGKGSKRYIDENKFKKMGIEIIWQNYQHPVYPQLWGEFIPRLSILDLLFNCGSNSYQYL